MRRGRPIGPCSCSTSRERLGRHPDVELARAARRGAASLRGSPSPADEIVVVDNGSTDGTAEHSPGALAIERSVPRAAREPRVRRRHQPRDRGGVRRVVVLVNNGDLELTRSSCASSSRAGGRPGRRGGGGEVVALLDDRGATDAAGDTLRWRGVALQPGRARRSG